MTEFAKILLRHAKLGDWNVAPQLVAVLHDPMFHLYTFVKMIKTLKGCEEVSRKSTKGCVKDDGLQRVLMKDGGGYNGGHGITDVENICEVFQRLVKLCGKKDIM